MFLNCCCSEKGHACRGTSFDGCELLRSNDEAEETASSPEVYVLFHRNKVYLNDLYHALMSNITFLGCLIKLKRM